MKGIILAGGNGTRLFPITKTVSKQLLCIYDKPMVYYPLSTLLMSGIRDILIISTPEDLPNYIKLLGSGKHIGINISFLEQKKPEGLAQAFLIAEDFIGNDNVCMILGDNIFHGNGLSNLLKRIIRKTDDEKKATVFGYYVNQPNRYGVLGFNKKTNRVNSIEEKPIKPKSNYAVVGLYFYPNSVINIAKNIKLSDRGEFEITSVNNHYLSNNRLNVEILGKGYTWLDTGTPDSLLEASNFIQAIEKRQGLKVSCIEEICFKKGYISKKEVYDLSLSLSNSEYGKYLLNISKK